MCGGSARGRHMSGCHSCWQTWAYWWLRGPATSSLSSRQLPHKESYDKWSAGPDIITKTCWANQNSPFMIQGISYMIILAEQQQRCLNKDAKSFSIILGSPNFNAFITFACSQFSDIINIKIAHKKIQFQLFINPVWETLQ